LTAEPLSPQRSLYAAHLHAQLLVGVPLGPEGDEEGREGCEEVADHEPAPQRQQRGEEGAVA